MFTKENTNLSNLTALEMRNYVNNIENQFHQAIYTKHMSKMERLCNEFAGFKNLNSELKIDLQTGCDPNDVMQKMAMTGEVVSLLKTAQFMIYKNAADSMKKFIKEDERKVEMIRYLSRCHSGLAMRDVISEEIEVEEEDINNMVNEIVSNLNPSPTDYELHGDLMLIYLTETGKVFSDLYINI